MIPSEFDENGYLKAGLHDATPTEIRARFVDGFPGSNTRRGIMDGYDRLGDVFKPLNLPVVQWIDGSFATSTQDPKDIDMLLLCDFDAVNRLGQPERITLDKLIREGATKTRDTYGCHLFYIPTVPKGHPLYDRFEANRKYWLGQFGFDRMDRPKGILRVTM